MSIETSGLLPQTPVPTPELPSLHSSDVKSPQQVSANEDKNNVTAIQAGQKAELSVEKLQAAVEKMNELMQNGQRSLNFSVDDSTERVVVKVMDTTTQEVVRQIPTEETLKFAEHLEGMLGLLLDDKA